MPLFFKKLKKPAIILGLFLLFFSVGSYDLGQIPNVLNQDEMTFALGAKKLSETGYDLCGTRLPLFPCETREFPYRYATTSYYLTASFYKLSPPSSITDIRIFSVLLTSLAAIVFLFFSQAMLQEKKNKFLYAASLSAAFYFSAGVFTLQRFGAPFYALSVLLNLLLLFAIYKFHSVPNKKLLLIIPLISAFLMLDYPLYRFFAPLYFLFFALIFRKKLFDNPSFREKSNASSIRKIKSFCAANKYFLGGLAVFSVFFYLVLTQTLSDASFTGAYLSDKGVKLWQLLMHYYSFELFYFKNNITFFYSSRYGLFESSTIVFFFFGLALILKDIRQNRFFQFIMLSLITYPLAAILTREPYATNRIINLIPAYFIIVVYGFTIFVKLTELSRKKIFSLLPGALLIIILLQSFYFLYDYFFIISGQNNYCKSLREGYTGHNCNFIGLFDYLRGEKYGKIYFDSSLVFIGAYADFYNNIMNYGIKNYEVADIAGKTGFEKNGIIVISKEKAQIMELEKKHGLINKISEPNTAGYFFQIFKSDRL